MRHKILILAGILPFFSSPSFASLSPSEWDRYCRKCHIDRPVNALYDPSISAHKNASLSCVGCHRDKGIAGHVKKSAEILNLLFQGMTLPPDIRPQQLSTVSSDQCLACHFYIREVDEIDRRKLSKDVRPIGLRAAHSQHWDYRVFTTEERNKLMSLTAKKTKSALSKTEQADLDRYSQVEKMQCARCHERFRSDSPGGIDPNVNIAMKNPMECTACHVALRTTTHPGDTSPLPSAVSCERCHHGNLHQKMIFSPVDYGTETDCLRCHSRYAPEEIRKVRPDQFSHKSTASRKPGTGEKPEGVTISTLKSYRKSGNDSTDRKY